MKLFIGQNLHNIRILHGYTRKQLAEILQMTEQSVWQYENGYTSPKMDVVNKLKEIFHVKSQYFYIKDMLTDVKEANVNLHHIAYRSTTINSIKKTQTEAKHVKFIDAFLKRIEVNINYSFNQLKELRDISIEMMNEHHGDRLTVIKQVADNARRFLKLDEMGNKNLLFILEKYGAFIVEKSMGEKVDAYSLWTNDGRPYMILGNIKKSAVRRNFDLAHELGHLLLHYKVEFTTLDNKSYREFEREANFFAGELLLPEAEFSKDVFNLPKKSNPVSYIDLKKKWHVSIQAMAYRAHALKLITYQQYRYFNMQLHRNDYKVKEPLDDVIAISKPGKIRSILQLLFEKEHMTLEDLLDMLKVDVEFLINLLGVDQDFFSKYATNIAKQFTIAELQSKYN